MTPFTTLPVNIGNVPAIFVCGSTIAATRQVVRFWFHDAVGADQTNCLSSVAMSHDAAVSFCQYLIATLDNLSGAAPMPPSQPPASQEPAPRPVAERVVVDVPVMQCEVGP